MTHEIPDSTRRSRWRPDGAIFALALFVRLVVLHGFRDVPFFGDLIVDSRAYDLWARRLAGGDWIGDRPFYQAPLYPYLLGIFYSVFGRHLLGVRVVQALLGAAACVVMRRAVRRWFGETAGRIAGFGMALFPPAVFFDLLIQKSVLDSLFVPLVILALGRAFLSPHPRARAFLGVGITFGLFALNRENALLSAILVGCWTIADRDLAPGRRRLVLVLSMIGGLALPLLPVYVRNASLGARTAITTWNVGTSLYIGNHRGANGMYLPLRPARGDTRYEETDARELAEQESGTRLTPDRISRFWLGKSAREIAGAPGEWLWLLARKAGLAVNQVEVIDTDDIYFYEQYSVLLRVLNALPWFALVLGLSAGGVVAFRDSARRLAPLLALSLGMFASLVVFYVVGRYRYPLALSLFPLGAAFAAGARHLPARRRTASLVVGGAVAALAFLPMTTKREQLGTSYFNAANILAARGDRDGAVRFFDLSLASGRGEAATRVNYAALLMETGRAADAWRILDEAAAAAPGEAPVHLAKANASLRLGKPERALAEAASALRLDPASPMALNTRGAALAALGRGGEAADSFREALGRDPGYVSARLNWARLLRADGETTRAIILLREGAGITTGSLEISRMLGELTAPR